MTGGLPSLVTVRRPHFLTFFIFFAFLSSFPRFESEDEDEELLELREDFDFLSFLASFSLNDGISLKLNELGFWTAMLTTFYL